MREIKVGLVILAALAALAAGIFLVGQENNLFVRKDRFFIRFESAGGLSEGNPVQLNGVNCGRVERVVLPEDVQQNLLIVWVSIDRRFAPRVRADSVARIKTLGLLGDKYVEVTSGSARQPAIPDGGEIPAAQATDVDELIASGENAVDNLVAISVSLRNILARMEAGEGVLGELSKDTEIQREFKDRLRNIMAASERVAQRLDRGEGTLGALLHDESLLQQVERALDRFGSTLTRVEEGQGILPALLDDAEARERFTRTLTNLDQASEKLAALAAELHAGDGLLPKLLSDEEYGRQLSKEIEELVHNLNTVSARIEKGEGTLGQLVEDPEVYQAINDILVGIDESRMLRWLIRNRQKKGIEQRYRQERSGQEEDDAQPGAAGEEG